MYTCRMYYTSRMYIHIYDTYSTHMYMMHIAYILSYIYVSHIYDTCLMYIHIYMCHMYIHVHTHLYVLHIYGSYDGIIYVSCDVNMINI